jgi:hypothetical protein
MKKFPILIILLLAISFLSFSASATLGYINACGTIQYDGEYILNQSISSSTTCLTITASNVTINLSEYRITTSGSGHIAIYLNNNSTSGTYYIFGGELFPAYSVANTLCLYSNGGTLSLKNIRCLAGGSGFVFLNTNVIIIDSSYAGSFLPIQISSSTGEYYQLNINNSNISTLAAYSYIRDIGTFPNLNRSIMKIFNSRFTGSSTYFLYNTLGNSLNNDSQIVNCYFGNVSTTFLNGFRGSLNNAYRGNYYAYGGFGYSEVCTPYSDGICSVPNNFSTATDYYPIQNISLLSIPVSTTFSWNPSAYTNPNVAFTGNYEDYYIPSCVSSLSGWNNFLFCDDFNYAGNISLNGWKYTNPSNYSFVPTSDVVYNGKSFLMNVSKGGIYRRFFASLTSSYSGLTPQVYTDYFGRSGVRGSYIFINSSGNEQTLEYAYPKKNVQEIDASFYVKENTSIASGLMFGFSQNPVLQDSDIQPDPIDPYSMTQAYFLILDNRYLVGIFNYTSNTYWDWVLNVSAGQISKINNRLIKNTNGSCSYILEIEKAGNKYSFGPYQVGFSPDDPYFRTSSPCDTATSFFLFPDANYVPVDNVEIKVVENNANLNTRFLDCSNVDSVLQPCTPLLGIVDNCANIIEDAPIGGWNLAQELLGYALYGPNSSTFPSSYLPMSGGQIIIDGNTYYTDSQGYVEIDPLIVGSYQVNMTYKGLSNYINLPTKYSDYYLNVCWFGNAEGTGISLTPTTNASQNISSSFFDTFGDAWSDKTKMIIGLIGTLAITVGVALFISSAVLSCIVGIICVAIFTAIGFFPFWVVILLVSGLVGAILLALKPGQ